MSTQWRIVIYPGGRGAEDDGLLAAIDEATGLEREAVAQRLRSERAVYLPALAEGPATELAEAVRSRGLDADLEPVPPDPARVEWLAREIPKWVKRGFVPVYSLPSLYQNYGLPAPPPPPTVQRERDPGLLVRAVLTIGAVLVGLGLILFVASNWQRIPAPAKIGGALALTLAALHVGYRLRFVRGPHPRLSACFLLIALFGIGGVVALIAQTYHLLADTYLLPLVWGALCLPVALLLRFQPALYLASLLWLWSYWLYPGSHGGVAWFYAALLLGFLLPYSIATRDDALYAVHVGLVLVALATTLGTDSFWLATTFAGALAVLRWRDPRPVFDWLLAAGLFLWQIAFLLAFDDLPNALYALPLAYFFFRAHERRDNWLLLATVANTLVWLVILHFTLVERFDLGSVEPTGFLLWTLATGVLVYGFGAALTAGPWRMASSGLRTAGAGLALLAVYVLSFRFYETEDAFFGSPLFLATSIVFGGLGIALAGWARRGEPGRRRSELLLLGLVALALALALALSPALGAHVVLFNLILFAAALVLMLEGHRGRSLLWYNLGIAVFVVLIVSRYFDTFVDLLPRSAFFILGGVFLIGWAALVDRQRRRRRGAATGDADA